MKMTKVAMLVLTIAVALFALIPSLSWADDGATIYKTKCAACHGADAAGKPAAKIPSLISDDAKKVSDADLTDMIANGGKDKKASHAFANKGLTPDAINEKVAELVQVAKGADQCHLDVAGIGQSLGGETAHLERDIRIPALPVCRG